MKAYSEAQRAIAVEILGRHGGHLSKNAITEIREMVGSPDLPKTTIWRWLQKDATEKQAATPEARTAAAKALDVIFEEVARKYTEHALKDNVVNRSNASQAMTAAAIAVDKMRLLRDLPTEIIKVMPEFVEAAKRHHLDPYEIMRNAINEMDSLDAAARDA